MLWVIFQYLDPDLPIQMIEVIFLGNAVKMKDDPSIHMLYTISFADNDRVARSVGSSTDGT